MSLNKKFLEKETNIQARVIQDSISPTGQRVTTFELEYPRFIHSELMTHRELSKNSSSSRAIPLPVMIQSILSNTAVPIYFGKNQKGMQASTEVNAVNAVLAAEKWIEARNEAIAQSEKLHQIGLHKQIANRVTESFQMMKVVMTTTGLDNLLNLRLEKDAQPEFMMLAYKILDAANQSRPKLLQKNQWHLPYVEVQPYEGGFVYLDGKGDTLSLEYAVRLSVASCAAVSYRTEAMDMAKADRIFDMLIHADVVHASPFEHIVKPIITEGDINKSFMPETWEPGITHVRRSGALCSGNSVGFIQYRHLIDNNTCHDFDHKDRMRSLDSLEQ